MQFCSHQNMDSGTRGRHLRVACNPVDDRLRFRRDLTVSGPALVKIDPAEWIATRKHKSNTVRSKLPACITNMPVGAPGLRLVTRRQLAAPGRNRKLCNSAIDLGPPPQDPLLVIQELRGDRHSQA